MIHSQSSILWLTRANTPLRKRMRTFFIFWCSWNWFQRHETHSKKQLNLSLCFLRCVEDFYWYDLNEWKRNSFFQNPNADPERLKDRSRSSPYIVAIFSMITKQANYYIYIENRALCVCKLLIWKVLKYVVTDSNWNLSPSFLAQVPKNYTFIQVIDLFIKAHNVLHLNYSKEFCKVMQFLEFFIYDLTESKCHVTTRMNEVAGRIIGEMAEGAWVIEYSAIKILSPNRWAII